MKSRRRDIFCNEQGMAILITIMVISLLIVVTVHFNRGMRQEMVSAVNVQQSVQLDGMARAGVDLGRALLLQDGRDNGFDSLHDRWARVGRQTSLALVNNAGLHVDITDLSGRFQLNSLVDPLAGERGQNPFKAKKCRQVLKQLLLSGVFAVESEAEAAEIVESIVDWIDRDDQESIRGAEDAYYRTLPEPYSCKNGPIEFVEELLLVRGISRDLLYGTEQTEALADYITAQGSGGKININSADPLLLLALDERLTPELAERMVDYRDDPVNLNQLSQLRWYTLLTEWPRGVVFESELVAVNSDYFAIYATATLGRLARSMRAVVQRDEKNRLISLYTKVE